MIVALARTSPSSDLARYDPWCRTWFTIEDMIAANLGVPITHGICPDCEREMLRAISPNSAPSTTEKIHERVH